MVVVSTHPLDLLLPSAWLNTCDCHSLGGALSVVSVIIPAYNAERFVAGAIESVLAQTLQDWDLIVVDDGSEDGTAQVVKPFLADCRVQYIHQRNKGLPGARNAGALVSNGQYLAFLDADDFLAPNALEMMRGKFDESGAAWLNVGVLKLDGTHRTVRHPWTPDGDLLLAILKDDFIVRSPFYPRKEFFAIGMYDEQIRMREDWDLNIRMIAATKPFALLDEPLYLYSRTEGSITTGNLPKLFSYTESVLRKHHKKLADEGNKAVARIYATHLWQLARRNFYEVRDFGTALRCFRESMHYDLDVYRLFHPLVHCTQVMLKRP
jgi:glycosyltransferase involved in cell wall biosynthesis